MKKTIFYTLTLALLATGCTTKEQDEQIHAFWQQQLIQVMGLPTFPPAPMETPQPFTQVAAEENAEEVATQEPAQPTGTSSPAEEAPTLAPVETPTVQKTEAPTPAAVAPSPKADKRIRAFLFTHSNSPLCQQLKQDHWDTDFQQKYQDKILLVEYDMIDPANRVPLRNLMHRYQLPSLTVPIIFIGKTVLPGYPFTGVDEAVQKALADQARAAKRAAAQAKAARQAPTQYMEIIMEDNTPVKNSTAPAKDRRAMQKALASIQQSNQQIVTDIGTMFGHETQAAAFAITARTERLLKNKMADSPNYKTYASFEKKLMSLQERDLNDLMRQNAKNIRAIRG